MEKTTFQRLFDLFTRNIKFTVYLTLYRVESLLIINFFRLNILYSCMFIRLK